jgi:hypothetical protein
MWRTLTIVAALLLVAFLVSAQNTQTPPKPAPTNNLYTIPLDAAHKENPVKSSGESLAAGNGNMVLIARCATAKTATAAATWPPT